MDELYKYLNKFEEALLSIDRIKTEKILNQIREFHSPQQIIDKIIVPSLQHIGEMWENGNVALSQIYMSGRICEVIIEKILISEKKEIRNEIIGIANLEDYHPLGKKILKAFLKSSGYTVIDYGTGVSVKDLIELVKENKIDFLMISTLMLRSALEVKELRKKLNEEGIDVKLIVGGAPFLFDDQLWKQVGADAMGFNAFDAIKIIRKFV
jgi:methanogenic corrinoid protein MtbC1